MPIASDATRVAALLTGEVDLIEPVPVQDIGRVNASSNARVLIGPELRTIFLGFDQLRDELLKSDVAGRNPFKDRRVRQAIYQAIDIESIRDRTMRGLARPSALMIAPELFPKAKDFPRLPFDPAAARGLLVEAGYQGGFEVGMDCPNDRYVNDEAICQAVAGMLAKIGVRVRLNAQPKARFFAKVLKSNGYRTSLYLLGWTPSTTDAQHTLEDLYGCRTDPKSARGHVNLGGYCNRELEISDRSARPRNRPWPTGRDHQKSIRNNDPRLCLCSPSPTDARLGSFETGHRRTAAGQLRPVILGDEGAEPGPVAAMVGLQNPSVRAVPRSQTLLRAGRHSRQRSSARTPRLRSTRC